MKSLGKKVAFVAVLVGSLAIPLTVFAQSTPYSNFADFLAKHPKDAQALSRNPALANNPQWLDHHPKAKHFFHTHKNVKHGMRTNASQFMSSTQSWRNPSGNYAHGFTGNTPQVGPRYQQNWAHGHGHDWDHDNDEIAGRDYGQGWHGHHYAYGHDEHPGHGHHYAYGHDKQDNWEHGHHGPWEHGHGGHDQDND